jgi:hypothetical protein
MRSSLFGGLKGERKDSQCKSPKENKVRERCSITNPISFRLKLTCHYTLLKQSATEEDTSCSFWSLTECVIIVKFSDPSVDREALSESWVSIWNWRKWENNNLMFWDRIRKDIVHNNVTVFKWKIVGVCILS